MNGMTLEQEVQALNLSAALANAVIIAIKRRDGGDKPQGRTDNASRWYPSDDEHCDCCDHVREPSRSWPWSIYKHCFTAEHVANLYGQDVAAVKAGIRAVDKARKARELAAA
jgi:hypothetical protein